MIGGRVAWELERAPIAIGRSRRGSFGTRPGRSAEFCWVPEPFLLAREENHACMISSYLVNIEAQS
uniref:Uncharacterized protein n=1 Tax=Triticum urartu TaxID=4572 RepID=A0A8R7US51_TRIUA